MQSVDHNPDFFNPQLEGARIEVCALGHPLGDCPARRAGCSNHWAMLQFMLPPWPVRDHIEQTMGEDPAVREWISHLEAVLPGDPETRVNWP